MRERMCALTRRTLPETEMIRFVAAPDGTLVPDVKANLPGRGVWICARRDRIDQAVEKKCFSRALRAPVKVDDNLSDRVAGLLRRIALGRAGLARKAGQIRCGFAKTEAELARQSAIAIVIASDAAEDGRRKMRAAIRRHTPPSGAIPDYAMFTSAELNLALGRTNVIHAAVRSGSAGLSFLSAADRLERFERSGAKEAAGEHEIAGVHEIE